MRSTSADADGRAPAAVAGRARLRGPAAGCSACRRTASPTDGVAGLHLDRRGVRAARHPRPRHRGRAARSTSDVTAVVRPPGRCGDSACCSVGLRRPAERDGPRSTLASPGSAARSLRASSPTTLDPELVSVAEPVTWRGPDGERGARLLLPAAQPGLRRRRTSELPRSSCMSHGGPTGMSKPIFDSRPAVLDDPRHRCADRQLPAAAVATAAPTATGSKGPWGVVDVDDCVVRARWRWRRRGRADRQRLAIRGGSAGGYTTLAALTFRDVFTAGREPVRCRRPRDAGARHPQVRVALPGPAGRAVPRGAGALPSSARRSTTSTRSAAR